MFTGIVETVGTVLKVKHQRGMRTIKIRKPAGWKLAAGESVAVEGVCSTVQKTNGRLFQVSYMPETLRRTTLGRLQASDGVNLERSLRVNSLLAGHLVQGHVDTTGRVRSVRQEGEAKVYEVEIPLAVSRYVVAKGSIAVDGISLTVVASRSGRFTVSLIPYTLSHTTLGGKGPGDQVNIEVDILAKYLEKLLQR